MCAFPLGIIEPRFHLLASIDCHLLERRNLSTPSASAGALATMAPFGLPPTGASAPAPLAMFSSLQTQAQAPFAAFSLSSAAATSAGPDSDWAIPISSRRKNIQQFNELDKQKHGFLTALDGRNALVKTGLSTPLLAQIWCVLLCSALSLLSTTESTPLLLSGLVVES